MLGLLRPEAEVGEDIAARWCDVGAHDDITSGLMGLLFGSSRPPCSARPSPARRPTFDMRGGRKEAKPACGCPLDGRVRPLLQDALPSPWEGPEDLPGTTGGRLKIAPTRARLLETPDHHSRCQQSIQGRKAICRRTLRRRPERSR